MDWERLTPLLIAAAGETAFIVLIAMAVGGLCGLAIGLGLYLFRPGNLLANRIAFGVLNVAVNIVRPIPFIIFLMAIGPLNRLVTGSTIGIEPFTFALAFMATFVFARLVEQNLLGIDPGVVEAARAMGAGPVRIIATVLIPEALAPLILGFTFLFVAVLDASAVAGYVGAGGLGDFAIVHGYRQFDWGVTAMVVLVIIVIVHAVQWLGNTLARKALRR
ncbi:methionine ABC transporter permease [Ruania rhizosphaerae]|uniref:methionine ABC transporter permease n=1 Tax=Ruania rhizosphaerae TaxID=1840413 RepID=UPI001358FE1C|nr:methionine ABC transporter permease [Ruania rhizosphaerae]